MLDEWLQRLQNTPCPKLQVVERNRTQWEYTEVTLPQKTTDDSLLLCLHSVLAHFYFVQECHPGVQFCKQSTLNDSAQFLHTFPVFLLLIFLGSSIRRERLWMPGYCGQPAVILIDPRYTRVKGIGIFGSSKAHAGTGVIPFAACFQQNVQQWRLGVARIAHLTPRGTVISPLATCCHAWNAKVFDTSIDQVLFALCRNSFEGIGC